ncbi:MAG TPA: hypothetical protein VKC54_04330, partial [Patescibacteria group bacterium]|nr:hypothetical protein [Patescibacteria group bacterium]
MNERFINFVGPCAAETESQIMGAAEIVAKHGEKGFRVGLWKPRTSPGFEGVGSMGIPWLKNVTKLGLTVAAEAMLPDHVDQLTNITNCDQKLVIWIGSRNQNHLIQKEIAARIIQSGHQKTFLMIKNQPWLDEKHWLGIVDHVLATGFPSNRLFICHRGFAPSIQENPHSFRNIPSFEMAMKIKEKTQMPMLIDPSHIGGSIENVFLATELALNFNFDGFLLEFHPNSNEAKTDQKQQL